MLCEKLKGCRVILGSLSPRRRELLGSLDIDFEVIASGSAEEYSGGTPSQEVAVTVALAKAAALTNTLTEGDILITADTVVLVDGVVLPKPANRDEAIESLRLLSGRSHMVITGVAVTTIGKQISFSSETVVTFCELEESEIEYYTDRYKPYDKAGSYGIQEWIGFVAVEKIEGSYFNVMGLPVNRLYRELKAFIDK